MDLAPFTERAPEPLPERPAALFVGVLERYKAVDVLVDAWTEVAAALPEVELRLVGRGSLQPLVEKLVARSEGRVRWTPQLSTPEVAAALDDATALVLPSRGEGMGRVIVEAFCRRRAVIGTRSGGIPDLVEDGVNGVLVPVDNAPALARALVDVLGDPARAEALGSAAGASAGSWVATPAAFAERMLQLVEAVLAARS
jgi:glycosyltransferase involved in cell wall biosynthesis